MNNIWYKELGFYNNPFSIKPAAFHDELVAYDLQYIYKKIDNGEMLFIDGTFGTGKTTILKNIINRYKGKRKVIYYNFDRSEKEFNIDHLLVGANSLVNKMIGLMPKNIVLLLDEVVAIKKKDSDAILKYYDNGNIKSVILVNHDYYSVKLTEDIERLLEGNVIRTAQLTSDEALILIRKRIGNIELMSDTIIKRIFTMSEKNPRHLLENCEDICKYAVEHGDDIVTNTHVDYILNKKPGRSHRKEKANGNNKISASVKAVTKEMPVDINSSDVEKQAESDADLNEEAVEVGSSEVKAKKTQTKPAVKKSGLKKKAPLKNIIVEKEIIEDPLEIERETGLEDGSFEPKLKPENEEKRQKKFKKNKLFEDNHGESIIPNLNTDGNFSIENDGSVSSKNSTDSEENTKPVGKKGKGKQDISEYNVVFYND